MALTQTQISQLYVAIFNRASEGEGNQYWQTLGTAAAIAQLMIETSDSKTYFGSSLNSNQAFIEHIYLNTLNKTIAQDPSGIAYWKGLLDNGSSRGEVVASLVNAISTYAPNGANYNPSDAKTVAAYNQFANRVSVSDYMANTVFKAPSDYATSTSFSGALTVTSDSSTVTTTQTKIQTTLATHNSNEVSLSGLKFTIADQDSVSNFWIVDENSVVESWVETDSGYSDSAEFSYTIDGLVVTMSNASEVIVLTFPDTHLDNGDVGHVESLTEGFQASFTLSNVGLHNGSIPEISQTALDKIDFDGQFYFRNASVIPSDLKMTLHIIGTDTYIQHVDIGDDGWFEGTASVENGNAYGPSTAVDFGYYHDVNGNGSWETNENGSFIRTTLAGIGFTTMTLY